jgi:hypothetical protein
MSEGYKAWFCDNPACKEAILTGQGHEAALTGYGENDFWLEFLVGSGLWETMVGMEATELKKQNGKPARVLNGIEVIWELADIEAVSHLGKILSDARLMMIAGFNVEELEKGNRKGKLVIDPETLSNHLSRINPESTQRSFIEHVRLLRQRRWIRGKVYAADAKEIIVPYGRKYEGIGHVGEKWGYKLVVLLNITPGRERVVGFSLAPLQKSERAMLREILERLHRDVAPLREWMDVLVLDRGYWGAEYLTGIRKDFGIDYVTKARDEGLDVVEHIEVGIQAGDTRWVWCKEKHSLFGDIRVRSAAMEDIPLYDEKGRQVGTTNAVVSEEFDMQRQLLRNEDGSPRRFYYITSLPVLKNPVKVRSYYRMRWIIENQGFRELNQRWNIERLAGRRLNAINARIAFALMLYNAEHIMKMRHPGPWQDQRYRLSGKWATGLGGLSVVVYTPEGKLGLFSTKEYSALVKEAERRRIVAMLESAAAQGQTIEDVVALLHRQDEQ